MASAPKSHLAVRSATSETQPGLGQAVTEPPRPRRVDALASTTSSAADSVDERVRVALAESGRAEQTLSALHRAIEELGAALSTARGNNDRLTAELGEMKKALVLSAERQVALERRVAALTTERDSARQATADQQRGSAEGQDQFLHQVLEDHEKKLASARREMEMALMELERLRAAAVKPAPAGDADELGRQLVASQFAVRDLEGERDRTREILRRLQAQRDAAQLEVAQLSAAMKAATVAPETAPTSQAHTVRLPGGDADAAPTRPTDAPSETATKKSVNQSSRKTDPARRDPIAPFAKTVENRMSPFSRGTPAPFTAPAPTAVAPTKASATGTSGALHDAVTPPELMRAVFSPRPSPAADEEPPRSRTSPAPPPTAAPSTPGVDPNSTIVSTQKPPLPRKPDPTTTTLGGYSVAPPSNTSDHVDPRRLERHGSSKPPR